MDKAASERQYINVLFEKDLIGKIDDFRFAHRLPSRTEAIRWLVNAAIEKKLAPKKQGHV